MEKKNASTSPILPAASEQSDIVASSSNQGYYYI